MSTRLDFDKYYTPTTLAKHCIDKTYEIIGRENIVEIIEPSAGNGSFSNQIENCISYDIEPEHPNIIKQDFLELDIPYKKGRLFIGNPPFGHKSLMVQKFYRHATSLGDYIAFIVPISQFNNNQSMFQFDLTHSEDLGEILFSDKRKVRVAFNIYKRPPNGKVNSSKLDYKMDAIEIKEIRQARNQHLPKDFKYDIGFCSWGNVGKIVEYPYTYNQEMYVKVNDENIKDFVIQKLNEVSWGEIFPMSKSPTLKQWQVRKFIYEELEKIGYIDKGDKIGTVT